jgi:hypothetical protein
MFFVPAALTNILFLGVFYLSVFQHVRMREIKPTFNLQFFMAVFSLIMVLVVAFENRKDRWFSMAFLVIAVICLATMWRQMRYLPPRRQLS